MDHIKSRTWKRLSWVFVLLVSGMLYVHMPVAAQATEETEPSNDDDEETSVCEAWGGSPAATPTIEGSGLSIEVQCIIGDTYLVRHDMPGSDESPDLLRRYLQKPPYENLSKEQYITVMEEAVRLWPQSRYAHAGLAEALRGPNGIPGDLADRRRAADEFLVAADIAFSKGSVRYVTELSQLLADLKDKEALDRYFKRVFELLPEWEGNYRTYLDYAFALDKLDDERAETYFQKAIAFRPDVGDAYEFYGRYLLDHGKAQKVLELLALNSQAERATYPPTFHYQRYQALEQLGQKAEAAVECQQARDLAPPRTTLSPSPAGRPGSGPPPCKS